VSAGYGQPSKRTHNIILQVGLTGKGLASTLIDKTPEFRHNMFKAALRGHTLRLLGGLTDEATAQRLTQTLWGGIGTGDGAVVGKLGVAFHASDSDLELGEYEYGRGIIMPTYELKKGTLTIFPMQEISDLPTDFLSREDLSEIATLLVQFSLLLGGFGKSWRRIDHEKFYPEYLEGENKPLIGCHWEFTQDSRRKYIIPVNRLGLIGKFIAKVREKLKTLLVPETARGRTSSYVEAWHEDNVEVWGCITSESKAVKWFHGEYERGKSVKRTPLFGEIGKIGRVWHRMYPHCELDQSNGKKRLRITSKYVELLTIFPDDSNKTDDFLEFLEKRSGFQKIWPQQN